MATKRQTGSSFSITDDLFGSKDSISNSSSSGIFDSLFPPPSTAGRRNFSGSEVLGSMQKQSWSTGSGIADNGNKNWKGGSNNRSNETVVERNSNFQQKVEPCPLSSSLYYGGQEDMYGTLSNQTVIMKKTMTENDPNENNSNDASRGNWWQGSLYY
ncbi:uncharacterized protein LOC124935778 [Impatiens glandulifera]|uniref:uncharacterized protein LOC124935778 n=1 Tax=Impatiens glandulifera TaxID=253017 RepID=UPI001FB073F6|nr:uncharacterized protein LOC124935778 [Impatiens glandulifera]